MTRNHKLVLLLAVVVFIVFTVMHLLPPPEVQVPAPPPTTHVHPFTTTVGSESPMPTACVPGTVIGGNCW